MPAESPPPPLLLRADGNSRIGMGHLMRCFALGRAWRDQGGEVAFRGAFEGPAFPGRLEACGILPIPLDRPSPDPADLASTLSSLEELSRPGRRAWLALDGYHFSPAYQKAIRDSGYRLVVVDDGALLEEYHSDVILNQNAGSEDLRYRTRPETLLLLGPRFALLRPEFLGYRGWRRIFPDHARKVLITMGGADPMNATLKGLRALEILGDRDLEAVILVGPSNPHLEALQEAVRESWVRVRLLANAENVPEWMAWADVALSASGTTCWELSFMGLPSLLLVLADNQRPIAKRMGELKAAISLGRNEEMTATGIARELDGLCKDRPLREALSTISRSLVDGRGTERLIAIARALEAAEEGSLRCETRPAEEADAMALWRLANDPDVRKNSLSPGPIPLESHLSWYAAKLCSPRCRIWVMEVGGVMVAQIRYDQVDDQTIELDYSVVPVLRGRGLGTKLLNLTWKRACEEMNVMRVRALVIEENASSARAFLKAGFGRAGDVERAGRSCMVFEKSAA